MAKGAVAALDKAGIEHGVGKKIMPSYKTKRIASMMVEVISDILANEAKAMDEIYSWLAKSGAKKALIHLDLDVLDPKELYAAVGNTGILSVENVINAINLISQNTEVVGLSIAEHLPKAQIKLKELLSNLPLIKE